MKKKQKFDEENLVMNKQISEEDFKKLQEEIEKDAKNIKLRDDMVELIKHYYKEGDIKVLEQIVQGFEPLMYKLAKPYYFSASSRFGRLDRDDFIQEAKLLLIEVLKNKVYDPKKCAPITYFFTMIKNKFIDVNLTNSSAFKFSRYTYEKLKGLNNYNDLVSKGVKHATAAKKSKLKKKDFVNWQIRKCIDIETHIKDKDNNYTDLTCTEFIADKNGELPGENVIKEEFYNLLKRKLTELEYQVVLKNNIDYLSTREIAEQLNMKESKIKGVLAKGMEKLRNCKELETYIGAFNR